MWRLGAVARDAVGKRDVAVPATKQDFDPAFGEALLREGIETMLVGDINTCKAILRDYIKATVGFEKPTGSNDLREGCRASTSKLLWPPLRIFRHNS